MDLYDLKDYILESCNFLGIEIKEKNPDIFHIRIPLKYIDEFNQIPEYLITFERTSNPNYTFVNIESFFIKKLSKLVADSNHGVSTGSKYLSLNKSLTSLKDLFKSCTVEIKIKNTVQIDKLLMWFKTSVKHSVTEEYLKGFEYDIKSGEITEITNDTNNLFNQLKEEFIPEYDIHLLNKFFDQLIEVARKDAKFFIEEKEQETKRLLEDEIKRINDYYDLLEHENQLAESSKQSTSPKQELELLKVERNHLIEQQKLKYNTSISDATIEPVAILLLRYIVELAQVELSSNYGKTLMNLSAVSPLSVKCSISNEQNGPYTITSDDQIVKVDKTFNCNTCGRLYDHGKKNSCKICHTFHCIDCVSKSNFSGMTVCSEHITQCSLCLDSIATDEMHLCENCKQFYCKKCNPQNICSICSTISQTKAITPTIQEILQKLPKHLSARKFEYSEKGNRVALVGKGLMFKIFFLIYDKKEQRIVELQEFGMFNKKK